MCTTRAVYIALSGERAPSWPALRAAESRGHLSDAIHLRRLTREAVHIITQPNPCAFSSATMPSSAQSSA